MRATFAPLALAALAAANPVPSASFPLKTPSASAPAGCQTSVPGTFEIEIVNATTSSKTKRDGTPVVITLQNGILTDANGRVGSIVANGQFQFDGPPPQSDAIYTAGWSVCSNGSLTLGAQSLFYECLSGMYYNLYDESVGGQCSPIYIQTINAAGATAAVSQLPDGQVTGRPVTQISDGQPQVTTKAPVTQISDGQVQATTGKPVTQISDGQVQATTGKPVTQISDGQVQGPTSTGKPVTQISDGQVQGPTNTGKPVTQISDGQVQGPTGKPVTQISDGQVQGPTGKPVTQISDGQVQGPTGTPAKPTRTGSPVTQISDGQVQGPTGAIPKPHNGTAVAPTGTGSRPTTVSPTIAAFTGAAAANTVGFFGLAVGAVAFALF